ncbi:MAG: glucose 1-dehydrogenase [Geminicoccaceae bacterium]|nr:MAG: glucose 1-dehydrogenase [Geminicoccaceae bacterium]
MKPFDLAGKKALVTGASRGIGAALAVGLAEAGADVAIAARTAAALEPTRQRIDGLGRHAAPIAMDVRDIDAIRDGTALAASLLGGLDILVANAGIEDIRPSLEVDEALWDRIVDTNLKGAFFTCQAAARIMAQGQGGAIVTLCSLTSEKGVPTAVPYGSAKTGLVGMTRALAAEWAAQNIRVNGLGPGYFRTDLTEIFYQNQDWADRMQSKIPLRRFGQLDDLVGPTIFLASDAARYITGQVLYVDGGTLAAL